MPMKTRSRKRTAGRAKRSNKKRSFKKRKTSFKQKALKLFPSVTSKNLVYYETVSNGTQVEVAAPNLAYVPLINMENSNTWDGRDGQTVHLLGFRIRNHYQNKLFRPQVVHCVLCTPRDGQNLSQTAPFGERFFKRMGLGSTGNRDDIDFSNSEMSGIHYATFPVNTDTWNVLWHTRFKLGVISTAGGYSSGELKNYRSLYRYIPINKTIRFRDNSSNFPEDDQQFFLFTWSCPMDYEPSQSNIENALTSQQHVVAVYKRTGGAS